MVSGSISVCRVDLWWNGWDWIRHGGGNCGWWMEDWWLMMWCGWRWVRVDLCWCCIDLLLEEGKYLVVVGLGLLLKCCDLIGKWCVVCFQGG